MIEAQKKLSNPFYALLSLPSTAMGFALSVQISALSWILNTKYGLDIHEIGIVWAAGPLAGIFGQVIVGLISDKVWFWGGRRRPFILAGGVLASLMFLALPNIQQISDFLGLGDILIVALFIALTLDMAINISFNPTRSIIADVTPEGVKRTKGYTWMQTISGFFGVLAYVIGAVWNNYVLIGTGVVLVLLFSIIPTYLIEEPRNLELEESNDPEKKDPITALVLSFALPGTGFFYLKKPGKAFIYMLPALIGYVVAFTERQTLSSILFGIIIAAAAIVHLASITFSFRTAREINIANPAVDTSLIDTTNWTELMKLYVAHGFSWIGVQTMFVYIIAFIQQKLNPVDANHTGQIIAISFAILNTVGFILPVLVLEPLTERIGRVKTHFGCMVVMAAGYFLIISLGTTTFMLYFLMAILGIGWAAVVSLPFAIMSEKVHKSRMGFFMGIFNLSVVLPQLIVSLILGYFINLAPDKNIIFWISGISLSLSALFWLFVSESNPSKNISTNEAPDITGAVAGAGEPG